MGGELLVILLVALIVFGPSKLPMLADHLGKLLRQYTYLKQQLADFWQKQLMAQELLENQKKAEKVDKEEYGR